MSIFFQKNNNWPLFIGLLLLYSCSSTTEQQLESVALPIIKLDISSTDMLKIRHKRERALRQGLLVTKSNDYVPAQLSYQEKVLSAKVRLKGDWLDHLRGDKWSWRVKLADTCQLEGMQRFSLQHPKVRSYLDEWVFHKLLEQEGILTTKYTFVQLVLNDRYKGIYALEEHFHKALLHANDRPEGPILKFAEDGFWQSQAIHKRTGQNLTHFMPVFESAEIEAFQMNSTLGNVYSKDCFRAAKNKLQSMRMADQKPSDLVDINLMSNWYALSDLVESYHSLRWHNMRFYYHPIKGTLEPVVYDAFGNQGAYRWFRKPLLGSYGEYADTVWLAEEMLVFSMFNDTVFRKDYHQFLEKYAQHSFTETFLKKIEPEFTTLEKELQKEFKGYQYDRQSLSRGANRLEKELKTYKVYPPLFERVVSPHLFDSCRSDLPIPEVALRISPISSTEVELVNWFCQPITIRAIGVKKSDQRAIEPIELPAFTTSSWPPPLFTLSTRVNEKYFYYTVPNNDSWFRQKISPWPIASQEGLVSLNILRIDSTFMSIENKQVKVRKGQHTLSQLIVIPSDYEFVIEKGTYIDMTEKAAMLICGSALITGSEQKKIRLLSSDNSSQGIHFSGDHVKISYVEFDGHGDWWGPERWYKGGVTILESSTNINNSSFVNMRGEDALNIVGTKNIVLENLSFEDCEGDALDLDYCQAHLKQLSFKNIGGDGLDFSGSIINGKGFNFTNISDKSVSIGESSIVNIQDASTTRAYVGVAIKDASEAVLSNFYIDNCEYGVAVFNKKPIFTAASAKIANLQYQMVGIPYVLEDEHQLNIDGQEQQPTHKKYQLFQIFYPEN